MRPVTDMVGQRFGRLEVMAAYGSRLSPSGQSRPDWICRCDCGKVKRVLGCNLRQGNTVSCGCKSRENLPNLRKKIGD